MEARPDTSSSSGPFRGQWSFLANPPQHAQQPRSLPPSSYILQSDRSSISPLPTGLHYHTVNGSRSSLPRNLTTASVGGRSVVSTAPSQPVLIRVHSADASAHTNPAPRPRRRIKMTKNSELPAMSEFSIKGILAAIQEDIEQDVNTISEILGRSRLVLADQHDSHMPPQGEIRAVSTSLQAVEEASPSDEQSAMDSVFILRDDASLIAGSQTGSAAYGLLERLQAVPRTDRMHNDWAVPSLLTNQSRPPGRYNSSPAVVVSATAENQSLSSQDAQRTSRNLLQSRSRDAQAGKNTLATVSESHLLAEAEGSTSLFSHTTEDFEPNAFEVFNPDQSQDRLTNMDFEHDNVSDRLSDTDLTGTQTTFRERMQNLLYVSDPTGLSVWLQGQHSRSGQYHASTNAEGHLRELLER